MSRNMVNYNPNDERTANEKYFGYKMWDIYEEAHGREDFSGDIGFEIETSHNHCHIFKEIASLRVTHVPRYYKNEFQRFIRDEAHNHRRGAVKTAWLFDHNNRGNMSQNDTVVFVTFENAVDNLWFIVYYDNTMFPPNDHGLRIAVKPNGFSNNPVNLDYMTSNFTWQLEGISKFVEKHYPKRVKGLVVVDGPLTDSDNEHDQAYNVPIRRAVFTDHYHADRQLAAQANRLVNDLDVMNTSFSSQTISNTVETNAMSPATVTQIALTVKLEASIPIPNEQTPTNDVITIMPNESTITDSEQHIIQPSTLPVIVNANQTTAISSEPITQTQELLVETVDQESVSTITQQISENTFVTTVEHRDEKVPNHISNAVAQRQPNLLERFLNVRPIATLRNFRIPRIRFEYGNT